MYQDDLVKLSKQELIALALAQTAQSRGIDAADCRPRGKAGWATQDPRQLLTAAVAGAQAQQGRPPRGKKAEGASRRVSGACPQSGPDRCERCRTLPALRPRTDPGRSVWLSRL